jgi:hypothetical protein
MKPYPVIQINTKLMTIGDAKVIDPASVAHGCAFLRATAASLLQRLLGR